MYLEKNNGYVYLTIDNSVLKKQIENTVNNLLSWIVAGVGAVTLLGAIYYGNVAYQLLTTLL